MPVRAILHIDMDAFYAAVEVLDDPSLRGKPVIVGGTPEGRGVVTAASYEARAYGVRSAMSAARAVKLCPDGIFLRGRMKRYVAISRRIRAIFLDYTPLVEPLSIDEAFLDVTGCRRLFGSGPRIGRAIKAQIAGEIGLTASVGVAKNKFLAKLASDLDKPDGFVVVPDDVPAFLAPLPVSRIWGVGKKTEAVLARAGIRTIGALQAIDRDALIKRFGDHAGHLHDLAYGRDERSVVTSYGAKSIGHETTFSEDIADGDRLRDRLDRLAGQVARRLRRHGRLARTVSLKARYADFSTVSRSLTLPEATDSTALIRDTARQLLLEKLGRRGRALRLIGVSVSNLCHPDDGPRELFPDTDVARDRQLDQVMDRVNEKFGDLLRRGTPSRRQE